jgi:hypothetical protein
MSVPKERKMKIDNIIAESQHKCPHCGGPVVEYSELMEKKDACYYKVKASAKVWPSAYASGRLVQCRKKGAGNYGKKNESLAEAQLDEKCWDTHKQVGMKNKGGRQVPNCVPKESVAEVAPPGAKAERMVKHIKKGYAKDGKLSDKEKSIAYATAWKAHNKGVTEAMRPVPVDDQGNRIPDKMSSNAPNRPFGQPGDSKSSSKGVVTYTPTGIVHRSNHGDVTPRPRAVPEGSQRVDSLVTDALKIMQGSEASDAVAALKTVLGDREYNSRRGFYNFYVRQLMDMSGQQGMAEDYNPEYDDEAGMADNNLETLSRAVEGIDDLIQSGDNLPEWCQEKIAVAKSMLVAVWDYMYSEEASDEVDPEVDEMFEAMDQLAEEMAIKNRVSKDLVWEQFEAMPDNMLYETAAWRRKEGKSKKGGLNAKGVASYRRENPGSKLQMAVTTKPSKLKPGSKAAKRRKSFCARMGGVKGPMKKPNGKPTRKALALRKWNC